MVVTDDLAFMMDAQVETGTAPSDDDLVQSIVFGRDGNDTHHLGQGWADAEPGFRWTVGVRSEFWLEHPGFGANFRLEVEAHPACFPPTLTSQRLTVSARGVVIARSVISASGKMSFFVPADAIAETGPVRLLFEHEQAASPNDHGKNNDTRKLAFCVRRLRLYRTARDRDDPCFEGGQGISIAEMERLTGMPAADFMLRFESLGDTCEFGFVQRLCGAEPLGLLRFAGIQLRDLMRGLEAGFEGVGEMEHLAFALAAGSRREYRVLDRSFFISYHTWQYEGEVDEAKFLPLQARRQKFLARKLVEDLKSGEKICVWRSNDALDDNSLRKLHTVLNIYGANTLLCVANGDATHRPGTIEHLSAGLVKGYVDRLTPYGNANPHTLDIWLDLCTKVYRATRTPVPGM